MFIVDLNVNIKIVILNYLVDFDFHKNTFHCCQSILSSVMIIITELQLLHKNFRYVQQLLRGLGIT